MIRLSLTYIVFIYLILFLMAIGIVWSAYILARPRHEKDALRSRVRCHICAFEFEDRSNEELPRCPRCESLNERWSYRRF